MGTFGNILRNNYFLKDKETGFKGYWECTGFSILILFFQQFFFKYTTGKLKVTYA